MLQTKRLCLRSIQVSDYQDIHNLLSFPAVDRYNTFGIPKSLDDTIQLMAPSLQHQSNQFAIVLKENNKLIGLAGFKLGPAKYQSAEIWYKLLPAEWGNGYATETAKALVQHCFETLNLHRVEAGCAVENTASINVLEKVGMQQEGRKRKTLPLKEGWSDNYEYGILKSEWVAKFKE